MSARYLTGIEEVELRQRTDLSEDTLRVLATLDHARDVYRRSSVEYNKRMEIIQARLVSAEEVDAAAIGRLEAKLSRIREAWANAGIVPSRDVEGSRRVYAALKAAIEEP